MPSTLFALSRCYSSTLTWTFTPEHLSQLEAGNVHFMSNRHSIDIGYRTQSCLNELYALRDFLLYFVFEDMYLQKGLGIRKGLELLGRDDRFGLASTLPPALAESDPPGIISLMSLYRNVFFHYLGATNNPLGQAICIVSMKARVSESLKARRPMAPLMLTIALPKG